MTPATRPAEIQLNPFRVRATPILRKLSDEDFYDLCQANPELRIELTKEGDLLLMPPTGGETGGNNFNLSGEFHIWVKFDKRGKGFDSSTGFTLPNGAKRSPDLAWVRRERWEALTPQQRRIFPPLCPDFVVELRSPSDSLDQLKEKMREYMDNGAQLGWLIDTRERKIYIYRQDTPLEVLDNPASVSGEPLLHGFILEMKVIWEE
ncbi:MAG: Uma2 family endonuclease [Blastocatellia bacterium]